MSTDSILYIHGCTDHNPDVPNEAPKRRPKNPKAHIAQMRAEMEREKNARVAIKPQMNCHLVGKKTVRTVTETFGHLHKMRKRPRGVVSYNPKYTSPDGTLGTGTKGNSVL